MLNIATSQFENNNPNSIELLTGYEYFCNHCEYEATSKAELNFHEKKHTGESPERIIDQAFDTIIKSPMANLFGAAVSVLSGPKTRSAVNRLSSSQQPGETVRDKNSPVATKRMRGTSLSPDNNKALKKPATNACKDDVPEGYPP